MSRPLLPDAADGPALLDAATGRVVSHAELRAAVDAAAERLAGPGLALLAATNTIDAIVRYLAALHAGRTLVLAPPQDAAAARLAATYAPRTLLRADVDGVAETANERAPDVAVHPDLALLLTTSGSTGSPKLVRLGRGQLRSNAGAIAQYLGIRSGDRAILGLPVSYSYGLSVLNSHLAAGACVVLTRHSFLMPPFWDEFRRHACTSFAGVPAMYETLHRLRFDPASQPTLRTMTQAGGALKPDLVRHFADSCRRSGARFFAMYGQTEATARIAYVPPDDLPRLAGSVGRAIPGGALRLEPVASAPGARQLVYEGPNVMYGYAEGPADLARGDDLRGVLATGDLAEDDGHGSWRIVGRLKRFAKIAGSRVSLDDVEREVEARFEVRAAAVDRGDGLRIVVEGAATPDEVARHVGAWLGVLPRAIDVRVTDALPHTASGKKDYQALGA